nr:MAG TPA: hypothetical protein [Caudoviricetes sp.]
MCSFFVNIPKATFLCMLQFSLFNAAFIPVRYGSI